MAKEKKKSILLRLDPGVLKEVTLTAVEQKRSIQSIVKKMIR
ncbi:hypothetical protein [Desulforhopalus vacuolatus]|nr:hypothetical protein [Desulforhopalus vacuolatus]